MKSATLDKSTMATEAQPKTDVHIPLEERDIDVGLEMEANIAAAQARLQAFVDAKKAFIHSLSKHYGANGLEDFVDWQRGFKKVE